MKAIKIQVILAAIALVFLLATVVSAGDRFQQRQNIQQQRIHQGLRNGQITKREHIHLTHQQRNVKQFRNFAMRDGRVDRGERRTLNHFQDRAGRSIHDDRHNQANRYRHPGDVRHNYFGPAYAYGGRPHRYYRPVGRYPFYHAWATPGWGFVFSVPVR
ncbi:MAG: hypothetical protein WAM61_14355 [Desulfobacterales bacterium]